MSVIVEKRDRVRIRAEDTGPRPKIGSRFLGGVLLATPFVALLLQDWHEFLVQRDTIGSRLLGIDYRLYTDATRRWQR